MNLFGDDTIDDDIESGEDENTTVRTIAFEEPESLPQPRNVESVFGHDAVERQLIQMYNAGAMPHALIFSGLNGIGKSSFAWRMIKFLMTHEGESGPSLFGDAPPPPTDFSFNPDHVAVKLIHSGGHPDLLALERKFDDEKSRYKDMIDVDQVRQVPSFMQKTPSMGGWRIVLIDDADSMNRNAQNALLKVLEEPPQKAILILIAHRVGSLIPTIRSRARVFNFQPLSRDNFNTLVKKSNPAIGRMDLDALYNIAGGSVGHAIRLMSGGALTALHQLTALLENWPEIKWSDIHMAGEVLGGKGNDENDLKAFEDILLWTCAQMAKSLARGTDLPVPIHAGPYPALRGSFTLEQWVQMTDDLDAHFKTVKYGTLDKKQAIFGAFSILLRRQ
jgi:DNA polymerase-3 subunit delta'